MENNIYNHQFNSNGAGWIGQEAELKFESACILNKLPFKRATNKDMDSLFKQAKKEHWDYLVSNLKIEVKAAKRINRYGEIQYDRTFIELHGSGWSINSGWLNNNPGADKIAFLMRTCFLIIDRLKLKDLVYSRKYKLPIKYPDNPENWVAYRRQSDMHENFILIPTTELLRLPKVKLLLNK